MRTTGLALRGWARWIAAVVLAGTVLTGCSVAASAPPDARSYPDGCATYGLSPKRCEAVVAWAKAQLPIGHETIVTTVLLPDPLCAGQPPGVICQRLAHYVTTVRFSLSDGSTHEYPLLCGVGGQFSLLCTDTPQIETATNVDHDTICTGTDAAGAPSGCTTPFPSPDPSTLAASRPLRIAALDLPVATPGHHEVEVGRAVLPQGYVTEASFSLANDAPDGLLLSGPLDLELRSTVPGRPPFGNVYQRGIFPGVEEARVVLVFDVAETAPGAVIGVRDLVVR